MVSALRSMAVCLTLLFLAGCTSRGLTVTSNPAGAELSINRRVVGKTPMRVGFTHYGTYRIELRKKGYGVLVREEDIKPGFYGYDPAAFVADNIIPARLNDEVYLHYKMAPLEAKDERTALLERANAARNGDAVNPHSGEHLAIDMKREPKRLESAAREEEMAQEHPAAAPAVVDTEAARKISGKRPEGMRIANEYGIATGDDKRGSFERVEQKKAAAPSEARVPVEEGLIYDQPAISDPDPKASPRERKPGEKDPAAKPSTGGAPDADKEKASSAVKPAK